MSVPSNFTVSDRNSGSTGPPVHSWSGMESIWISLKTAVTVTSFHGIVKDVSAALALPKSTPSQCAHCTNAWPGSGSPAVIVTVSPARAIEFVVEPPTTVTDLARTTSQVSVSLAVVDWMKKPSPTARTRLDTSGFQPEASRLLVE